MGRLGEAFEIGDSVLTIVGEIKGKGQRTKYIFECSKCSLDEELFPYGSIRTVYENVAKKGQKPCACSIGYRYSESQNILRVKRRCDEIGYKFLGWEGFYQKDKTYLKLHNPRTGNTWTTTTINNFFRGYGDPVEGRQNTIKGSLIADDIHISSFFNTGSYHKDSNFRRCEGSYWQFTCGNCKTTHVRCLSNFKDGKDPCGCSGNVSGFNKSKPAYLYIVLWYGYGESYLKFGITNQTVSTRVNQQARKSSLDYKILYIFHHESGQHIWDCEKLIKKSVITPICSKNLLPDGYTETTEDSPQNLNKLLNIISSFNLKEITND